MKPLSRIELEDISTPEARREYARSMVLAFAESQWDSKDGPVNHTVDQLRKHFDTKLAIAVSGQLGVSWQPLIDELIRSRVIKVTNGFVWVH
jgi:hypothetical protein